MAGLTVSHHIHLTRTERYDLVNGHPVKVVGVSIPVWFAKDSVEVITSEPAVEVFVEYDITRLEEDIPIASSGGGYQINLPVKIGGKVVPSTNPNNLKDIVDGGAAWLRFREANKFKKGKKLVNVTHFIEIGEIEELTNSLELTSVL